MTNDITDNDNLNLELEQGTSGTRNFRCQTTHLHFNRFNVNENGNSISRAFIFILKKPQTIIPVLTNTQKVLMLSSKLQPNRILDISFVQNGHNINEIKLNKHSTK